MQAHIHFDVERLDFDADHAAYYKAKTSDHTNIWVEANNDIVHKIIRECKSAAGVSCEGNYADIAKEYLLLRDIPTMPDEYTNERYWMAARKTNLLAKPTDREWSAPPLINIATDEKIYDFDVRPDCSYWLSLQAFGRPYAIYIRNYSFVPDARILYPYLIVEFTQHEKTIEVAENRIVAAGSLCLYNRCLLRRLRATRTKKPLAAVGGLADLRIYGITMERAKYTI